MKTKSLILCLTLLIILNVTTDSTLGNSSLTSLTSQSTTSVKVTAQSILSQMEKGGQYKDRELLVKFKSDVKASSSALVHQAMGAKVIRKYATGKLLILLVELIGIEPTTS